MRWPVAVALAIVMAMTAAGRASAAVEVHFPELAAGPVLAGSEVVGVDPRGRLLAAPATGGQAVPVGPPLTGAGERARVILATSKRVLVAISLAGSGNGMRAVTGILGGPLSPATLSPCDPAQVFALDGDSLACIGRDGSYRPVLIDLTGATPPRTFSEPLGGGLIDFVLHSPWLLVANGELYDTRSGKVALRATNDAVLTVAEDGTLIVARGAEDPMFAPCGGRSLQLGWRTPTSTVVHGLPYRPCAAPGSSAVSLHAGRFVFATQARIGAAVPVVVGDLSGHSHVLATLGSGGALQDTDATRALAHDSGCGRTDHYFVLDTTGPTVGAPLGSLRCPAQIRHTARLRIAADGIVRGLRVRCPRGCLLNLNLSDHKRDLGSAYPTLPAGPEREVRFRVPRSVVRRLPLAATLEVLIEQRTGSDRVVRRRLRLVRG